MKGFFCIYECFLCLFNGLYIMNKVIKEAARLGYLKGFKSLGKIQNRFKTSTNENTYKVDTKQIDNKIEFLIE